MKHTIRKWLGLDATDTILLVMRNQQLDIANDVHTINRNVYIIHQALGRIIAKLDPMYAINEFDPQRKAASDKIGEEVIKRLKAEQDAILHGEGKL